VHLNDQSLACRKLTSRSDQPPLPFVLGSEFAGRVALNSHIPVDCPFRPGGEHEYIPPSAKSSLPTGGAVSRFPRRCHGNKRRASTCTSGLLPICLESQRLIRCSLSQNLSYQLRSPRRSSANQGRRMGPRPRRCGRSGHGRCPDRQGYVLRHILNAEAAVADATPRHNHQHWVVRSSPRHPRRKSVGSARRRVERITPSTTPRPDGR
jgi:hypothetical protein